ncbi:cell division protein FtsQ/DivIB [Plantactinospora sp. KLBMP9567]|uniref:cell division protein FtsQ/DivIB n=1 Tax=Plantactinospora sp. KLBMP9567 TaxID=3085900 RepID=UPI002981CB7A|nr:FtsQ-type POTRA domain-containing protein [Plantactinospora sp. KLBMP9567]MDW5323091.1 FtsQ-type POTRA domain-containing protein [Plantactinospora sp. KLBMP9567]
MSPGTSRGRSAGPAPGGRSGGPGQGGRGAGGRGAGRSAPGGPAGGGARSGAGRPGTGRSGTGRSWRLVRAGADAVPPSVRRFTRRARQRRVRAALPWTVLAGVLVLSLAGAGIVYGTPLFGFRTLRVVGATLVTDDQVRQAARVTEGVPLARVDLDAVRGRVAELPPVARVTVSRQWPHTLRVEVVERTPVAVVPQNRRFLVVDAAGVVFQTRSDRPAGLPLARLGTPGPDDAATKGALTVLANLTPELRDRLVELVVEGPARITVKLRGGRTVLWGDASRSETKAQVATSLLAREGDTIDVRTPDVVTIR